ncbi:MAG: hypothetical protein AAF799_20465 [Myxococcota bacterium]
MDELKTNAQALLERAKPGFAPSTEQLECVRKRLSAEPPPPPPKAANWAWYAGALVLAGLLAGGVAVSRTGGGDATAAAVEASPVSVAVEPERREVAEEPAPVPAPATVVPAEPPRAPRSEATPEAPPSGPSPKIQSSTPGRSSSRRASKAPATDTFAAQLELIIAARKALEARAFPTARKTAKRYLDRFDGGSFDEEAEVLHLLASCGIERTDAVTARARVYVKSHDSRFARRVRIACLEPSR